MHAIDTNVLVRLIVRDDPDQTERAERFIEKGAWVSVLALAETVWVLDSIYEVSLDVQVRSVEMLLKHRSLVIQDAETVSAALEVFRSKPALGFSDCLILQMARKAGHVPLGTFDRKLGRTEGAQKL